MALSHRSFTLAKWVNSMVIREEEKIILGETRKVSRRFGVVWAPALHNDPAISMTRLMISTIIFTSFMHDICACWWIILSISERESLHNHGFIRSPKVNSDSVQLEEQIPMRFVSLRGSLSVWVNHLHNLCVAHDFKFDSKSSEMTARFVMVTRRLGRLQSGQAKVVKQLKSKGPPRQVVWSCPHLHPDSDYARLNLLSFMSHIMIFKCESSLFHISFNVSALIANHILLHETVSLNSECVN